MYALNLNEEKRILSACIVLQNGKYEGYVIVDTLPEGNISDYLYVDGIYVYKPLPLPEPEPTNDELQWQAITDIEIEQMEQAQAITDLEIAQLEGSAE